MNIETIKNTLPEFAKDIKLNLENVLQADPTAGLDEQHVLAIALASAYTIKHADLVAALESAVDAELAQGAKIAATIMAMNNIYYRFVHLVKDKEYQSMPAKLRMSMMAKPGIDGVLFELMSIAVSALNGCGLCLDSHTNKLVKEGVNKAAIQTSVRIAAVIHAADQALSIDEQTHKTAQAA